MRDSHLHRETQAAAVSGGLLYRLSVAFPTWAGAILVLYTFFWGGFAALRIRPR